MAKGNKNNSKRHLRRFSNSKRFTKRDIVEIEQILIWQGLIFLFFFFSLVFFFFFLNNLFPESATAEGSLGLPNGFESTLWSAYNYTAAQKVIQFVQRQQQVGIKVQVQALEAGQRQDSSIESAQDPATAPVRALLRGLVVLDRRGRLGAASAAGFELLPPQAVQHGLYKNPQVDGDIAKALVTTSSTEKAKLFRAIAEADLEGRALGLPGDRAARSGEMRGRTSSCWCVMAVRTCS